MIAIAPPKAPINRNAYDYIKHIKVWEKFELRPFEKDKIPAYLHCKALISTLAEQNACKEGLPAGFSRLIDMNFLNPLDETLASSQRVSSYCDQVNAVTGAKKADAITQSRIIITQVRPLGTPMFAHREKWNAAHASIISEPDLAMYPKLVAAMLKVSLNTSKANAMEEFVSQFINICESSPFNRLLMEIERLIVRSKDGFIAAEFAERTKLCRRHIPNNSTRSNQATEFNLERTEANVRDYVTGGVNRAPWRRRAGNVEMIGKVKRSLE